MWGKVSCDQGPGQRQRQGYLQGVLSHICSPEGSGQVVHCLSLQVAGVG